MREPEVQRNRKLRLEQFRKQYRSKYIAGGIRGPHHHAAHTSSQIPLGGVAELEPTTFVVGWSRIGGPDEVPGA